MDVDRLSSTITEGFHNQTFSMEQDTFGNIFKRKHQNEARLAGVQKCLIVKVTKGLLNLEGKLKAERQDILLQEELLWLQKSCNVWLQQGDENTKKFHTSTIVKRRQNKLEALMEEKGSWIEDKEQLKDLAISYYRKLFSSVLQSGDYYIRGKFPKLDKAARFLEEENTASEIHQALKTIGSLKASGPDGCQAVFYKKTWNITSSALTSFVLGLLRGEDVLMEATEATLVLILKEKKPTSIQSFCPISLCNVNTKPVTKVIVNYLKMVLNNLMSLN